MISRILIKKIKKHGFSKKDSFTIIDVAPKEYYKLVKIDKLYFPPNSNKENEENSKYYNILHKIIQTVQKHGYHNRVIFVLEKN